MYDMHTILASTAHSATIGAQYLLHRTPWTLGIIGIDELCKFLSLNRGFRQ